MRILIDGQTLTTYEIKRGIGRVFLALINAIVNEQDYFDWYITTDNPSALSLFQPAVQAKLTVLPINLSTNQDPLQSSTEYSRHIQAIIDEQNIDLYWNLNPLMLNVCFPTELKNVKIQVIIHDLIPKVLGYVDTWPDARRQEYVRRLNFVTSHATQIVAISQATANDLIRYYPEAKTKCHVIHHGINHFQFYPRLIKIPLYGNPYLLYVAGFDPRKNMVNALKAFAYFCTHDLDHPELQLFVACDANQEQINQFYQLADELNISNRVKLFYEVTDAELCELYANAELFFFPSLSEGFGLPILEAMASGIITIASDITVFREIGEETLFYCDPNHISHMAHSISQALTLSSDAKQQRIAAGLIRANHFTWQKAKDAYFELLKSATQTRLAHAQPLSHFGEFEEEGLAEGEKTILNIAFATPWPPEKSGIANYSLQLLQHLSTYCQITVFSNKAERTHSPTGLSASIQLQPLTQLENKLDQFDFVVYQLGNDAKHHLEIYKLAWRYPGIIVLHDFYLYQFMREAFANKHNHELYEMAEKASIQNKRLNADATHSSFLPQTLPLCEAIIARSKATIVHNTWIRKQLQAFHTVHHIHHGALLHDKILSQAEQQQLKQQFNIPSDHYVIGMFGFVNLTKRLASVLQAMAHLHHQQYPIKLLIVGEIARRHEKISELCRRLQLPLEVITVTGYVDDQLFIQLMELCDIYVGLRLPSMGETSGPLMKALGMGKPCIVSNHQQFAELPDDICLKILTDEREIPHLTAGLEALLRQPKLREQLGKNARQYIAKHATYAHTAKQYYHLFKKMVTVHALRGTVLPF